MEQLFGLKGPLTGSLVRARLRLSLSGTGFNRLTRPALYCRSFECLIIR